MTRTIALTLALMLAGSAGVPSAHLSAQAGDGWTTLFDGTNLNGWNVVGTANWSVADGAMQADSGTGFLVTPMAYGDFQLTLEFWVDATANSGVFIRCSDPMMITGANAYEVNIFDSRPDQSFRTGGIVDVAKPTAVIMTGGKWNSYDITARGDKMTVVLNGTTVVNDAEDSRYARGPVALQYGAGVVKFRNVRVRPL